MKLRKSVALCFLLCSLLFSGCSIGNIATNRNNSTQTEYTLEEVPDYSGSPYVELDGNEPGFSKSEKKRTDAFEEYSDLDGLGRCGVAYANICKEIMPTEKRGSIGQVKPSGWQTVKYNDIIDGNYLYNRCHLIGYQLAGENANEKNLITGTRYLNVEGMLPFEDKVNDYVDDTQNHVLYRVTPVFEKNNLVASGVEMEAWSVEDAGKGLCFHVYCYNVQPGIAIDYDTGDSRESQSTVFTQDEAENNDSGTVSQDNKEGGTSEKEETMDFVLNTNTRKFHLPDCSSVNDMSDHNKEERTATVSELEAEGYSPCASCLREYQ